MDLHEHDAFMDEIMITYWEEIRKYALSLTKGNEATADDLAQTAFVETHLHLLAHPDKPITNPPGWLHTLVHNRFVNKTRCKLDRATTSLDQMVAYTAENETFSIEFPGPSEDEPENAIEASEEEKEEKDRKKKAIIALALNELCTRVAIDRFVEGLSVQEIAYKQGYEASASKETHQCFS